jgi:hypothetical protein
MSGWLIAILWLLFFAFWLNQSLDYLFENKPADFQRLGSLAVAVAVSFFGYMTLMASKAQRGASTIDHVAMEDLEEMVKSKNRPDTLQFLTEAKAHGGISHMFQSYIEVFRMWEVCVVVLGTLQWGYGDLLTCWVNNEGWSPCY